MYRNFCYVNNFKCVWALLLASFVLNLNTKKLYFKERIDEHLLVYLKSYNFMLRSILLPQRSVTFDIRTPVNSGKYMACVFYSVYLNNLFAFISIVESIIDTLTRRSYFTCLEDKMIIILFTQKQWPILLICDTLL